MLVPENKIELFLWVPFEQEEGPPDDGLNTKVFVQPRVSLLTAPYGVNHGSNDIKVRDIIEKIPGPWR